MIINLYTLEITIKQKNEFKKVDKSVSLNAQSLYLKKYTIKTTWGKFLETNFNESDRFNNVKKVIVKSTKGYKAQLL